MLKWRMDLKGQNTKQTNDSKLSGSSEDDDVNRTSTEYLSNDSLIFREEIANLDDVILCLSKTKLCMYEEETREEFGEEILSKNASIISNRKESESTFTSKLKFPGPDSSGSSDCESAKIAAIDGEEPPVAVMFQNKQSFLEESKSTVRDSPVARKYRDIVYWENENSIQPFYLKLEYGQIHELSSETFGEVDTEEINSNADKMRGMPNDSHSVPEIHIKECDNSEPLINSDQLNDEGNKGTFIIERSPINIDEESAVDFPIIIVSRFPNKADFEYEEKELSITFPSENDSAILYDSSENECAFYDEVLATCANDITTTIQIEADCACEASDEFVHISVEAKSFSQTLKSSNAVSERKLGSGSSENENSFEGSLPRHKSFSLRQKLLQLIKLPSNGRSERIIQQEVENVSEIESDDEFDDSYFTDSDDDTEIREMMNFISSGDEKSSEIEDWESKLEKERKGNKTRMGILAKFFKSMCEWRLVNQIAEHRKKNSEENVLSFHSSVNCKSMAMYPIFEEAKYPPCSAESNHIVSHLEAVDILFPNIRNKQNNVNESGIRQWVKRNKNKTKEKFYSTKYNMNTFWGKRKGDIEGNSYFFTAEFAAKSPHRKSWLDDLPGDLREPSRPMDNGCTEAYHMKRDFEDNPVIALQNGTQQPDPCENDCDHDQDHVDSQPMAISDYSILKHISELNNNFVHSRKTSVLNLGKKSFPPKLEKLENCEEDNLAKLDREDAEKSLSKSFPRLKKKGSKPSVLNVYEAFSCDLIGVEKSMVALNVASEGRDYLTHCSDQEFDRAVADLDMRRLVDLVHALQDAMAVEQQTFESLSSQLEVARDPLLQQRLSAALCTSQTRLARLCSRNMRCFTQEALKSRHITERDGSSSPRDSGLALSSSGSEFESDFRSQPPTYSEGWSSSGFTNSLNFFQKAASSLVTNNFRNSSRRSHRETKHSSKKRKSRSVPRAYLTDQSSSGFGGTEFESSMVSADPETYEDVLFINGKPQFQETPSSGSSKSNDHVTTRITNCPSSGSTTIHIKQDNSSRPSQNGQRKRSVSRTRVQIGPDSTVILESPSRSVALVSNGLSRSFSDITTCSSVKPPKRKPVLNFDSVTCSGDSVILNPQGDALTRNSNEFSEFISSPSGIKRSVSLKEGLDYSYPFVTHEGSKLNRTHSCCDGLAEEYDCGSRLNRAPSVDEILELVKSMRVKGMVKSSPAPLQPPKSPRHKTSSKHRSSQTSSSSGRNSNPSVIGIRFNGVVGSTTVSSSENKHRHGKPVDPYSRYYENLAESNRYENLPAKNVVDVIYDQPKSNKKVEKRSNMDVSLLIYENVNDNQPLYENINESDSTYINVVNRKCPASVGRSSKAYANTDRQQKPTSAKSTISKKHRRDKQVGTTSSNDDSGTYDVPKAATPIYDSPPNQSCLSSKHHIYAAEENAYDSPQNNRSILPVLPESTQILLKAKSNRKIDDIFADCDQDAGVTCSVKEKIEPPAEGKKTANPSSSVEYIDEGLGESDARSYYADDQGLEVILEEPEDDCASSNSSEDDLRCNRGLRSRPKGERSLDGSEGIGSAEGDSHSSSSEIGVEDDCTTSGVQSEGRSEHNRPKMITGFMQNGEREETKVYGQDAQSSVQDPPLPSEHHFGQVRPAPASWPQTNPDQTKQVAFGILRV